MLSSGLGDSGVSQEWREGSEDRIAKVLQQIKREQELLEEWEIVEVDDDEDSKSENGSL